MDVCLNCVYHSKFLVFFWIFFYTRFIFFKFLWFISVCAPFFTKFYFVHSKKNNNDEKKTFYFSSSSLVSFNVNFASIFISYRFNVSVILSALCLLSFALCIVIVNVFGNYIGEYSEKQKKKKKSSAKPNKRMEITNTNVFQWRRRPRQLWRISQIQHHHTHTWNIPTNTDKKTVSNECTTTTTRTFHMEL